MPIRRDSHRARTRGGLGFIGRPLASVGAIATTVLPGCRDAAAPVTTGPATQRLLLTTDVPGDTLNQLGIGVTVQLSDSARMQHVTVWVDSGPGAAARAVDPTSRLASHAVSVMVLVPNPGTHTITAVADDSTGRAVGAFVTRTVRIADEAYTVTALPDLGAGSGATWVHPTGMVTGWVATSSGRHVPALWRAGALQVVPVPDSLPDDLVAVRTNTAGDVLVQDDSAAANTRHLLSVPADIYARGASVRRADGVWVRLGPVRRGAGPFDAICCLYARDLTESRRALGASYDPPAPAMAGAVFDVARGATLDSSLAVRLLVMNAAGQMAGQRTDGTGYFSTFLVTVGFGVPTIPDHVGGVCAPTGSHYTTQATPIDLDDAANLLTTICETPVYYAQPGAGASTWLDRPLGAVRQVHLSRQGGLVAGLDTSGTLYVWRAATGRTTHLHLSSARWRVRTLGAISADGSIAAEGADVATGRRTALLLTRGP